MTNHTHFPVSTKAILFSPDYQEVLVMQYLWPGVEDTYGFPGGHLEEGENPDDAITRELKEELEIDAGNLKREDFWLHESGKVVLAYSGTLHPTAPLSPSQPEGEIGIWVPIKHIEDGTIIVGSYKDLVLRLAHR